MSGAQVDIPIEEATLALGRRPLLRRDAAFDVRFFRDLRTDTTAMALACGDLTSPAPLLARVHSSCVTSECLSGRDCDCVEQLDAALAEIAREGRGLVYYLMQEGRGAGLTAKARDRMIVQASGGRLTTFEAYASMGLPADLRRYDVVAPISRLLGLRAPLRLLSSNPEKAEGVAQALADEKIEVVETLALSTGASAFNRDYLDAKHAAGHALDRPSDRRGATPPVRVRAFEPIALPGRPESVVTASYFLPIELPGPSRGETGRSWAVEWFRASVVYDRETERESIVLSQGASALEDLAMGRPATGGRSAIADERVTMRLFDRLPGVRSAGRAALRRALVAIRDRGLGSVAVDFDDRDDARP